MRLIIVEDDPLLLENLTLLLSGEEGLAVVGSYRTAEDALRGLRNAKPEVMLTDLGLPGMSGVDLIKRAKEEIPSLEIMAHTVFEAREMVFSAIKAGASGYILKGSSPREIIESIHELYMDKHYGSSETLPVVWECLAPSELAGMKYDTFYRTIAPGK
jgi:two-component system, NarL family, response regulator